MTGNIPTLSVALLPVGDSRLQTERRNQAIAQIEQRLDPSRTARDHPLGGVAGIERGIGHDDAEGIDELRAGQQRVGIDIGLDGANVFMVLPRTAQPRFSIEPGP